MKIFEIYEKYNIPSNLKEHMYRVAAVGMTVVNYLKNEVDLDIDVIITALLLHDMGNIVKYDFGKHISFSEEETARLKKIKEDFVLKYGPEEHVATINIAKELKVSLRVIDILENTGSSKLHLIVKTDDWYNKVCMYSDLRVAPYGIVSIEERFDDIVKRYKERDHVLSDIQKTEEKRKNAVVLESQIQEKCKNLLGSINNQVITPIANGLCEYNIS